MNSPLTTWSLLTATAGILAFLIGVYTLVGRDRKSPYLINSVFAVFLICLLGAAIDTSAQLVSPIYPKAGEWLLKAGAAALLLGLLITMQRLWTIYVRFAYFVDPGGTGRLRFLPGVRQWRARRKRKAGPSYEHNPAPLSSDLQATIATIITSAGDGPASKLTQTDMFERATEIKASAEIRDSDDPRSLAMALRHQGQANELLGALCMAFLKKPNHYIQYMTASRHPIEFIEHLKRMADASDLVWADVQRRIVAVDAHTPHFGFLDTINEDKSKKVRTELGDRLLSSRETYAGLHSAASAAFKRIKRSGPNDEMRQPTLVIYEDMYALSDLESVEQYRIFVRHVMPSERLWDGMFTIFVETAQREEDWKLISSYASMTLDLRAKATRETLRMETRP